MTGTPPADPRPVTPAYVAERLGLSVNAASLAAAQEAADAAPPISQGTADAIAALLTSPVRSERRAS
jgi:hypothetical protein